MAGALAGGGHTLLPLGVPAGEAVSHICGRHPYPEASRGLWAPTETRPQSPGPRPPLLPSCAEHASSRPVPLSHRSPKWRGKHSSS